MRRLGRCACCGNFTPRWSPRYEEFQCQECKDTISHSMIEFFHGNWEVDPSEVIDIDLNLGDDEWE